MIDDRRPPDNEFTLVSRINAGDDEAWKIFCEIYSPAIERAIRRYVHDREAARDLYVSLLEKLRNGKLGSFNATSTLTAWLFIVTRNHCKDYYRSASGVRHVMGMLKGLRPVERRFFVLFYIQGLSLHEAYESLRSETGGEIQYHAVLECDEAIRRRIAKKSLEKLTSGLLRPDAVRSGEVSIESMPGGWEIPDAGAPSHEDAADALTRERSIERLDEAVHRLPPRDQLILRLKFERGLSARQISEILDWETERQVYDRLAKLYAELREMLGGPGDNSV